MIYAPAGKDIDETVVALLLLSPAGTVFVTRLPSNLSAFISLQDCPLFYIILHSEKEVELDRYLLYMCSSKVEASCQPYVPSGSLNCMIDHRFLPVTGVSGSFVWEKIMPIISLSAGASFHISANEYATLNAIAVGRSAFYIPGGDWGLFTLRYPMFSSSL